MRRLTVRERKFFKLILETGLTETDAYLATQPPNRPVTRDSAGELGSRMMIRIRQKAAFHDIMDAAGLTDERLARKLNELLDAEVTRYWQGVSLGEHTDNATRIRAAELLAELRGHRKQKLEHSGTVAEAATVRVYLPDNGRGDRSPGRKHD